MSYNKKIIHALIILTLLMLSLVAYLTWFQIFKAPALAVSDKNPRIIEAAKRIKRGTIYSADGEKLAYSEFEESDGSESKKDRSTVQIRHYPYENIYCHVIGYCNDKFDKSKLEKSFNPYLSGTGISNKVFDLRQLITGEEYKEGADITLTIDHDFQEKAYSLLGDRNGSIVALNPKTGATLALVSKPDFDPSTYNLTESKWAELSSRSDSVFVARATSGLYEPGSVFKTITASAAIENGIADKTFVDNGSVTIHGHTFHNSNEKGPGNTDIKEAFARSSNVVFLSLADELGYDKMLSAAHKFMIGKDINYDFPTADTSCLKDSERTNVAAVGIGQGDTQVTPLNMALVAAAIANDGVMMRPYLVESADLSDGRNVYYNEPEVLSNAVSKSTAERIKDLMIGCVNSGTGTSAAISGIKVAGKTGTAENTGASHAWFIAFAPAEDPEIAVCVMVENAGTSGGATCGPIVRGLISYYLNR
ncbi:MAG: peptidoglycan glycosyltransferase [Clostridia bacterium]|nr:peptidoglycan glycosyltransferase [Clostridia bacterium]